MEKDLIETRRFYHKIAEPGWLEFKTTINIIKTLKKIGVSEILYGKKIHSPKYMQALPAKEKLKAYASTIETERDFDISEILEGFTGAVAIIDTKKSGPSVGFRFDIDALNIRESEEASHRPKKEKFISENNFAMHACGHDGHISIGLFLAEFLEKNKDRLKGKYTIIFQPAEEGLRGAKSMVETGIVDDIDYFFASHIGMGVENGKICVGTSGFLASTKVDVSFKGVSSHAGALPEAGKNANLAAASALLNLHTLPQFSTGMARINVGVIRGGSIRNAISDKAILKMETRGENEKINQSLLERSRQVIEGAAKQYDLSYQIKIVGSAPALIKTEEDFYKKINEILQAKGYKTYLNGKFKASEDVIHFINRVESRGGHAIHFIFGTKLAASHHSNNFDFDETCLETGLGVFKECVGYINQL